MSRWSTSLTILSNVGPCSVTLLPLSGMLFHSFLTWSNAAYSASLTLATTSKTCSCPRNPLHYLSHVLLFAFNTTKLKIFVE